MKPDRYTKTVLTIIALCLLIIAGRDLALFPTATAADMDRPNYVTVPLNEDGSLNVRVVDLGDRMDVNIVRCDACPIEVDVTNQVEVKGQVHTY